MDPNQFPHNNGFPMKLQHITLRVIDKRIKKPRKSYTFPQYLSAENREKFFIRGMTPDKLLYETFLTNKIKHLDQPVRHKSEENNQKRGNG